MKQLDHYKTLEKMPKLNIDCVLYLCDVSFINFGLILRSADIFGVNAVYFQHGNSGVNKKLSKLSRNSGIPVYFEKGVNSLLQLKKNGYSIAALEITDTSVSLRYVNFQQKICLIIGNEKYGIPEEILNVSDYSCHIEMTGGRISSLNAAVAASIALYEITQYCLKRR